MSAFGAIAVLLVQLLLTHVVNTADEVSQPSSKPNIIIILADDLGWNDVGFHGSNQIPTPNIDALAYNGLILNNHYVPALCTPSRAALLTGKHPVHIGMQHRVILETEPRGLPLSERIMPEYLRDEGYVTRAIGKWHLGFYRRDYLPTNRGFDSHYGYWNGFQDYYSHETQATNQVFRGYDMRRDMEVDWSARGRYSTRLFTEETVRIVREHDTRRPLFLYLAHLAPHTGNQDNLFQAPNETIARFSYIGDPDRRTYAAMVTELDDSVGEVVQALRRRGMLDNSIILFMSDNGAPTYFGIYSNRGSNWPFRGMKQSPWEGGVRGVAAMWTPWLNSTHRVATQTMHMSDWLPTLFSAAGLDSSALRERGLDGVDVWPALSYNLTSPRTEVLHNIDEIDQYAALQRGDWKFITGTTFNGRVDSWYGAIGRGYGDPEYDVTGVLNSKAGEALASISASRTRLTPEEALEMREVAEVRCGPKPISKLYRCNPLVSPCLFNIREDPCELTDLSAVQPLVAKSFSESLEHWRRTALPAANVPGDENANPAFYNNTWVPWQDEKRTRLPEDSQRGLTLTTLAAILGGLFVGILAAAALITKLYCKTNAEGKVARYPCPKSDINKSTCL